MMQRRMNRRPKRAGARSLIQAASRVSSLLRITRHAERMTLGERALGSRFVERAAQLRWIARDVCRAHGLDVRVSGEVPDGPVVLVANHVSYLDPVTIAGIVPCAPIAKAEVEAWPVIGRVVGGLGVLFVRREDPYSGASTIRRSLQVLRSGMSVLAFPEGTTTRGQTVKTFRRGVFGAAQIARVPVVPIAIRLSPPELCWVDDDLFLPHYLKAAMRARTTVHLDFGAAMTARSFSSAESLARAARQAIRHRLGLCEWTDSTDVALTRTSAHALRAPHEPAAGMERYVAPIELLRQPSRSQGYRGPQMGIVGARVRS